MGAEKFKLDAIVTVVDAVNFTGYEDTSMTARIQAQYTDLIVLNKCELVSERQLDLVVDHVNELNTDTPKVHARHGSVHPDLVLGLDSRLFSTAASVLLQQPDAEAQGHHVREIDILQVLVPRAGAVPLCRAQLATFLDSLPAADFYRIKGMLRLSDDEHQVQLLNYAFGRYELTPLDKYPMESHTVKLTFMGQDFGIHRHLIVNGLPNVIQEAHITCYLK